MFEALDFSCQCVLLMCKCSPGDTVCNQSLAVLDFRRSDATFTNNCDISCFNKEIFFFSLLELYKIVLTLLFRNKLDLKLYNSLYIFKECLLVF